jgi:LacI family transcriptional regulator
MKRSGNDAQPTINDVAERAGVSRATASRALSDYGIVNAETRERVQRSAHELGYVPNVLARSMRAGSTKTLGLIITEIGLSVFDLAVRVVIDVAHARGYQVLVANTNEDLTAERDAVRVMLEKQVDGVILVPSAVDDLRFLSSTSLQGRPVTLLDRSLDLPGVPTVTADNVGGARDAVAHLHRRGHRRIGFVMSTSNIGGVTSARPDGLVSTLHDRLEGYLAGLVDAGIVPEPDWMRFSGDSGDQAVVAVRQILDAPRPPTALIASNANVSLAILRVAKERGLAIGEQLSVIGFDDAPWAPVLTPGLTVVDLPIEEMAHAAVDILIGQIANHSPETNPVFPMTLIPRGSVATVTP